MSAVNVGGVLTPLTHGQTVALIAADKSATYQAKIVQDTHQNMR